MVNWDKVNHFNKKENWGDIHKINPELVYKLDKLRDYLGDKMRCVIHCGYKTSGHSKESQHYVGNAVDCHFSNRHYDPLAMYILAERIGFTGIGIYITEDGFRYHFDVREDKGYRNRWIGLIDDRRRTFNATNYFKYLAPISVNYSINLDK